MLAIVAIKWGRHFPVHYVNLLYRNVRANLDREFRFICVTDHADGIDPGVEVIELPDMGLSEYHSQRGRWQKLALFKPGLLSGVDTAIYMDLDTIIVGRLDALADHVVANPGLHILREWNPAIWNLVPLAWRPDRGGQSSILGWRPAEQGYLYEQFIADPEQAYAQVRNDQRYISRFARGRRYLPPGFCVSFKRHCVWHYPLNLIFRKVRKPRGASIVVFHGRPRPTDLTRDDASRWGTKYRFGFGPVDWVKEYWQGGLGQSEAASGQSPPLLR